MNFFSRFSARRKTPIDGRESMLPGWRGQVGVFYIHKTKTPAKAGTSSCSSVGRAHSAGGHNPVASEGRWFESTHDGKNPCRSKTKNNKVMKKVIKNTWDILTDEEKEFAPHWAFVMFVFPILLVAACALGEWLNSLW